MQRWDRDDGQIDELQHIYPTFLSISCLLKVEQAQVKDEQDV